MCTTLVKNPFFTTNSSRNIRIYEIEVISLARIELRDSKENELFAQGNKSLPVFAAFM